VVLPKKEQMQTVPVNKDRYKKTVTPTQVSRKTGSCGGEGEGEKARSTDRKRPTWTGHRMWKKKKKTGFRSTIPEPRNMIEGERT